ncbi:LysR family transcriptional regulator [Streptomyces endophyticus]|uniref:LysR family transcriptional regulator n=1 Tax=Streptomyces endophyticus TaxID=714166 RepID=A0ABU6F9H9_9ACTN|nr:LysR family transcriptional regulator [Streptomyces endophyticus]MEB8340687.1 LysR family transcriptional regulator [Streptomyces endophyticus]
MRYELTDLRLFLAIAEARSLSAGAAAVFITPSTASYRLKNLEQALGTPLFTRNSRGMEPTPAGVLLLDYVREALRTLERMNDDMKSFSSGLRGHVRLWANSSSLNGFVVPALGDFLLDHPHVNVDLEERSSRDILDAVAAQEIGVGILAGELDNGQVRSVPFAVDELVLAVHPGHELAERGTIAFGDALGCDFVCMSRESSNFTFLADTAKSYGRKLNVRLHVDHFHAVLDLVAAGVGVALVPAHMLRLSGSERRTATLRLRDPWAVRHLNLVTHAGERPPAFTSALIEHLLGHSAAVETRRRHGAACL